MVVTSPSAKKPLSTHWLSQGVEIQNKFSVLSYKDMKINTEQTQDTKNKKTEKYPLIFVSGIKKNQLLKKVP